MVQSLKKIHPAFFLITGLYLLASLYRIGDVPPPWYDEMVHLNAAGHLAGEGRIWCDFYTSKFNGVLFNGMPLHWVLLGIFVKLFGISIAGARFFYILLSALTLFCAYRLAKKLFDERRALYSAALLASCYIFFHNSRQVMPQVPAALFSVAALLAFYTAVEKRSNPLFIFAGFLTALAYLSHPTGLGMFFIISALFFYKKTPFRFYLPYLAGVFFTCLPYIVYVAVNFQEYVRQTNFILKGLYPQQNIFFSMLDEIPVRYFGLPPVKTLFSYITRENKLYNAYFQSIWWNFTNLDMRIYFCEIASRSPFILAFVYLIFRKIRMEGRKDLLLITALYIFLMSFHPNKFGPYIFLILPFLAMCLSVSYCDLAEGRALSKKMRARYAAGLLLLWAFMSSNLVLIYKELTSKNIGSYGGYIAEVSARIPKGSTVVAPVYFWAGMHRDYDFISANQIVYEIDGVMRDENGGAKFESLPAAEQENILKRIFTRHKIRYVFMTCHLWEDITEVPALAAGTGAALERYLSRNSSREKDSIKQAGFSNVSEEYQKSLAVYRLR